MYLSESSTEILPPYTKYNSINFNWLIECTPVYINIKFLFTEQHVNIIIIFQVFHFRNGGLNDLIHLFRSWKFFKHHCHKESHQHTFTIFRPKLSLAELHPEEGVVKSVLTESVWTDLLDQEGRIVDEEYVRKVSEWGKGFISLASAGLLVE